MSNSIDISGARVNNLKNVSVSIPRNTLTVVTGLSGSGKSSLAFDTIYAEGQRRYIDTFSSYARGFLGNIARPDVDKITGLSPVISIDQRTTTSNPRSTVGTVTEVYDYLRLLYARAGEAYSYNTGEKMVRYTDDQIVSLIISAYAGRRILVLAPLVRGRKGHYKELFEQIRKKGFVYVRVDGEMREVVPQMKVDRYRNHDIEVVVDRLRLDAQLSLDEGGDVVRLKESVARAMQQGKGIMMISDADNPSDARFFSRSLMCPTTGLAYSDPAPHSFSFNSPQGWCPRCKGIGTVNLIDMEKVVPDRRVSIYDGAIVPLGKHKNSTIFWQIEAILEKYSPVRTADGKELTLSLKTPFADLPEEAVSDIMNGSSRH